MSHQLANAYGRLACSLNHINQSLFLLSKAWDTASQFMAAFTFLFLKGAASFAEFV
jgi:hypothetical protein